MHELLIQQYIARSVIRFDKIAIFVYIPYSLYLAHSPLSVFKVALKMLNKITIQLAHSKNERCLPLTAVMTLFPF